MPARKFSLSTALASLPVPKHPDRKLDAKEYLFEARDDVPLETGEPFVGLTTTVDNLTELVERVLKFESDRETNLNARGAALTASAGILVTLSGFVATAILNLRQDERWEGSEKAFLFVMFTAAVAFLVSAAGIAVWHVLRPRRGPGPLTWAVLGDSMVRLLEADTERSLVRADPVRLKLFYVDRGLKQLPQWHLRNRRKARWLRRAYAMLGIGIALVGATVVLAVLRRLDLPYWVFGVTFGGTLALVWISIRYDFVRAAPKEDELDEKEADLDPADVLEKLRTPWIPSVRQKPSRRVHHRS